MVPVCLLSETRFRGAPGPSPCPRLGFPLPPPFCQAAPSLSPCPPPFFKQPPAFPPFPQHTPFFPLIFLHAPWPGPGPGPKFGSNMPRVNGSVD